MMVKLEGDFIVFLIGMRINKFWKVRQMVAASYGHAMAMPRMLDELRAKDRNKTGFLGAEFSLGTIVQYWRSFEHLEAFLFFSLFMRWHI